MADGRERFQILTGEEAVHSYRKVEDVFALLDGKGSDVTLEQLIRIAKDNPRAFNSYPDMTLAELIGWASNRRSNSGRKQTIMGAISRMREIPGVTEYLEQLAHGNPPAYQMGSMDFVDSVKEIDTMALPRYLYLTPECVARETGISVEKVATFIIGYVTVRRNPRSPRYSRSLNVADLILNFIAEGHEDLAVRLYNYSVYILRPQTSIARTNIMPLILQPQPLP
ncbi:hypothetical protein HYY70_01380 [Candidatus Woesearchaeota archaeon]|nr:hypothetical protein [Candidatus Woesearchaeota archaeon]